MVLKACCLANAAGGMQGGIQRSASQGAEGMLPGQGAGACREEYKGVPAKVLKACRGARAPQAWPRGWGHAERNSKECQPRC
jgi:hypothetical protein